MQFIFQHCISDIYTGPLYFQIIYIFVIYISVI